MRNLFVWFVFLLLLYCGWRGTNYTQANDYIKCQVVKRGVKKNNAGDGGIGVCAISNRVHKRLPKIAMAQHVSSGGTCLN